MVRAHALSLVMLLLMLGSATGVFAVMAESEATCSDDCDDQGGGCPPICGACLCAARGVSLVVPATVDVPCAERSGEVASPDRRAAPPSPDPQEILHVPKHASRPVSALNVV